MNNKIVKIFAYSIFLLILITPIDTSAARKLCDQKAFNEMKSIAYKINPNYELRFTEEGTHYFVLTLSNLSEEIEVEFGGSTYSYDEKNPVITLIPMLEGGNTYEFNVYGAYGYPCVGELLYTKKLTIPKYNVYSELEECIEYEEFPLCNKWYQGEIPDYNYFYERYNQYIESLNPSDVPTEKEDKNIFEIIIDFYIDHLIITLPVTIIFIGGIVFVVVRRIIRRNKRVKIGI